MRKLSRSNEHFKKAVRKLPLGVASNFRYWGDEQTIYVHHGKGGRMWDIDGNEYIDYRLGYGPIILGYADDRVDEAAREGMKVGGVFALSTEREYEVAAGGRAYPLLEFGYRSRDGRNACGTGFYRQGWTCRHGGWLPWPVQPGHVGEGIR
jgi:glutamate-1-semialdehyde 2,1-aminomutase